MAASMRKWSVGELSIYTRQIKMAKENTNELSEMKRQHDDSIFEDLELMAIRRGEMVYKCEDE